MDLARDPLGLTAEQLRDLGYRTVDLLVSQLTDPSLPAMRRGDPGELRRRLSGPPPQTPRNWPDLLQQTADDVLGPMSRLAHPGYFAFIPASSTFPGALGDLITSALDIDVGSWMSAAGPSQLELVVLDWFKEWIGYPSDAAGILVSGGSAANMTALACARETLLGSMSEQVVAYVADQTHSSVARAARLLGFRSDQLRILPTDSGHRLRLDALTGAIDADTQNGLRPLLVCANAGATNTGAVDPLTELAAICQDRGLWLHVDAAYGGFAALTERGRAQLSGLELADSVTLDPHKWLYQPIECGCLLVREGHLLADAFTINPDYLADYKSEQVNFSDLGLQLTRSSRALKVWLSFNYYGTDAFRDAIDRSMDLALLAEQYVRDAATLELLSPASFGIICFRRSFGDDEDDDTLARMNADLVTAFEATGRGLVSSTLLHGTYAIRLCVMNHTSGRQDVIDALEWFATTEPPPRAGAGPPLIKHDRQPDVRGGWARGGDFDERTIRQLPLFAGLEQNALEIVTSSARELRTASGETVVHRWHGTRHFYTIVSGAVEIRADGELVRELGPGDFFGELAALDWGAGFGYARTATVTASTPLQLLVLPPAALAELVRRAPAVERELRSTARDRLSTA
ncbi:MAG TPA: aminotransferase class I/II-fold pyridoxal phosphate-dependent enzyme [Solirubrobacteraceae bacterium]